MAYQDDYNTANSAAFQSMSYVASWVIAQDIAGTPIENTTQARKDWAQKVMTERTNITPRQLAFQMMRNAAVKAAGVASTDEQMQQACLGVLDDLVRIG
jgi:hypothetical protein